jgi:hypothetical protein
MAARKLGNRADLRRGAPGYRAFQGVLTPTGMQPCGVLDPYFIFITGACRQDSS